ncbi:hypothetical protein PtrSN002B_009655 [Pyrenophora tritici-repentis]|nr:hypothetical protein Alg215_03366 [Pyrenophora tritici-repentis]KAI0605812.1 hypothetical protein TUN205_09947 [Pyrenophora tritici-repentis]KAI0616651.1 hypothetical protein TUN199_11358 [Pyrenophora tritici-repentis]KAI1536354.1 hypothetical protein PtrSN002B_009655 [Pyrenophora tritici-repentis]KAI1542130.1 hypothetical protein PtrSN001A_003566 [Pyrenophora tritici-repentis]
MSIRLHPFKRLSLQQIPRVPTRTAKSTDGRSQWPRMLQFVTRKRHTPSKYLFPTRPSHSWQWAIYVTLVAALADDFFGNLAKWNTVTLIASG